jgi:WD40 repeat protein
VTATRHQLGVVHASDVRAGKDGSTISYHDLHRNTIVRVFRGGAGKVSSLCMRPGSSDVLLASSERGFHLWDLRQASAVAAGAISLPEGGAVVPRGAEASGPVAAFDATGVIFAIATPQRGLAMYDAAFIAKGPPEASGAPFSSLTKPMFQWPVFPQRLSHMPEGSVLPPPYPASFSLTGLEFSPDDKLLALGTSDRGVMLVDTFTPSREVALLNAHPVDPLHPCAPSWSSDGRWCTVGGADGHVYGYDVSSRPALPGDKKTPYPWRPGVWDPSPSLMGGDMKSEEARAAALAGNAAFRARVTDAMNEARVKFAQSHTPPFPLSSLGPPRSVPPLAPPFAASAEEQISRMEAPVTAVRWHPRLAVLASSARNVALWTPMRPE